MGNNQVAILIPSCDKYEDVWRPFFILFFKYWPDCQYPIYLISNNLKYNDSRVTNITLGDDQGWANNLLKALPIIPERHLIYIQEDYLFKAKVDSDFLKELLAVMTKEELAYLRIFPCPGPDEPYKDYVYLGKIKPGSDYRASLQAAIWDKEVLLGLIKPGENPWQMEILGSQRSVDITRDFLSLRRDSRLPISYLCTGVVKGRWTKEAIKFLQTNNINIDFQRRQAECRYSLTLDLIKYLLVKFRNLLFKKTK
jgi:hypothetical protein